jgi:hypothetical protein
MFVRNEDFNIIFKLKYNIGTTNLQLHLRQLLNFYSLHVFLHCFTSYHFLLPYTLYDSKAN